MSNKYFDKITNEITEIEELKKIITLPHIYNFQKQFYRIFKNSNFRIIFTYDNTIQQKILLSVKTTTPKKIEI